MHPKYAPRNFLNPGSGHPLKHNPETDAKRLSQEAMKREGKARREYLDGVCRDRPELRAEIEALIHSREKTHTLQPGSLPDMDHHPLVSDQELAGIKADLAGMFEVADILGAGGMGTVLLARQLKPVKREVALKLLRRELDCGETIARFESERQALALMNHRNIAAIYSAGATHSGRPYLVMEYVPGVPITAYCDQNHLTIHERLRLFLGVCQGIQHAHQKGIIHRDLKPSNVLVVMEQGHPVAKIIDFGIAKVSDLFWEKQGYLTDAEIILGTPAYMSPEQVDSSGSDIDTRSDVYSLGVLLYEMLTGALPITFETIQQLIARTLYEAPLPPSEKLLPRAHDARTGLNRGADIKGLTQLLTGDLDAIVMKSLAKKRDDRYASPSELALDISRFLGGKPIGDPTPRRFYRLRKFMPRKRSEALALVLGILALVVVFLQVGLGYQDARRARERASRAWEAALQEKRGAMAAQGLLKDMLRPDSPGALEPSHQVRQNLEIQEAKLAQDSSSSRSERAAMYRVLGRMYANLGETEKARRLLEKAISLRRSASRVGQSHPARPEPEGQITRPDKRP